MIVYYLSLVYFLCLLSLWLSYDRIPGKWSGRRRALMIQEMKSMIWLLFRTLLKCIIDLISSSSFWTSHHWCLWLTSYLQMSAGQPDEDEITWGSEELPIENLNSKMTDGQSNLANFSYILFPPWCFNSALTIVPSFCPASRRANHHWGRADLSASGQSGPWRSVHRNKAQHGRQNDEGAPGAEGPASRVWCKKPLWILLSRNPLNFIGFLENICFSFGTEPSESRASGRLFDSTDEGEQEEESLQECSSL